jgi:Flp pilus assembly protein TadG
MSRNRIRDIVDVSSNWLRRFGRSTSGNAAMLFGLTAITLLTAGGAGLDLSRTIYEKNRAAAALDAAGLAIGVAEASEELSDSELTSLAQEVFEANFYPANIGSTEPVVVTRHEDSIHLSVNGVVPTTLLQLAGRDIFPYTFSNEIAAGSTSLEVALVLDNTGSMSGSKLTSLKSAATSLIDTLSGGDAFPERLWFSVVPFAQTVRLDPDVALAGDWIDEECRSSISQLNFENGMCAHTVLETMNSGTSWAGCVEARPGTLATDDTVPVYANPDTLFVPYFQPDEPDRGENKAPWGTVDWDYGDDYLEEAYIHTRTNSQPGSNEITRLMDVEKYAGQNKNSNVNKNCLNLAEIRPLSNDMDAVKDTIDDMGAQGYTHIPFGAAWGWRTLSPEAPYSEGVEYDDDEVRKVLIIMTDGENTMPSQSTMNKSRYTAFGYVRQDRLGTTTSTSAAADELDDMLLEVCDNAKDNDVLVYTIGFAINSSNVQSLLNQCATDDDMYFNSPSASALQSAFGQIAVDLSNLRLIK